MNDTKSGSRTYGGGKLNRTEICTVRLTPDTLTAAVKVGAVQQRTVSSLMEHALCLYIKKNYPQAYDPKTQLRLSLIEAPEEEFINGPT